MFDRAYAVMDRVPGATLNELTYRRPEIIEDNRVTIAYQLGMHAAFSFVFGARDGYQTNYVFNPVDKILTRIDKESFLEMPEDPANVMSEGDAYTQEIAACELSNLKYIPAFRKKDTRPQVLLAFKQGFLDKYEDIKKREKRLLDLVQETRDTWLRIRPVREVDEYNSDTRYVKESVKHLISLDPGEAFNRLLKAKQESS